MFSAAGREAARLGRFSVAGVINTLFGYAVIFTAMAVGLSPYLSNVLGYCLGVLCSFALQKKFVFAANGSTGRQALRFLVAFLLSYTANFAVLHFLLQLPLAAVPAQLAASLAYMSCMYVVSRIWVFQN